MATKRKVVRSTSAQIRFLVDHMSANKLFANGEFTGPHGSQKIEVEWGRLRDFLAEHGPPKTVDQWKHTWRDLKKKVRDEGAKARIARGVTGNHVLVAEVSEITKKVLEIIGKECSQGLVVEGESGIGDFIALPEPDNSWGSPFADTDDTSAGYELPSPPHPALEAAEPSPCLPPACSPRPASPFVLGAALRPLIPWHPIYRVLHGVPLRGLSPRPAPPPPPRHAADPRPVPRRRRQLRSRRPHRCRRARRARRARGRSRRSGREPGASCPSAPRGRPAPRPAPPSPAPQPPAPPLPSSPPSTSSTRSQQTQRPGARRLLPLRATRPTRAPSRAAVASSAAAGPTAAVEPAEHVEHAVAADAAAGSPAPPAPPRHAADPRPVPRRRRQLRSRRPHRCRRARRARRARGRSRRSGREPGASCPSAPRGRPAPRPAPPSPAPQPPAPPLPSSPPSTSSTRSQQTQRPGARRRPARALEMSTRPTERYIAGQRQEIRHLQELVAEQRTRNFLLRLKLKQRRPGALSNLRF